MGKQFLNEAAEKLAAFSKKENSELTEGTSSYHKFSKPGEKFDGIFNGIETRSLDQNDPERLSECAILTDANNERHMFAQTIIVKELKKKWDETKETGFPVRILFNGTVGTGSDQYQSFKLYF